MSETSDGPPFHYGPSERSVGTPQYSGGMEPTVALRSVETRLRLILTELAGDTWIKELPEGQRRRLETWRANDVEKRGAHVANEELSSFTMTGELGRLILARWETFEPVFRDRNEFEWLLQTVENVRNTIAHSRELLPYEQDLLSGAAGKISQLVALHRASAGDSDSYFPRIERITDNLGLEWINSSSGYRPRLQFPRVDVGTTLTIQCSSTPVRGKALRWELRTFMGPHTWWVYGPPVEVLESASGVLNYTLAAHDVAEVFGLSVSLHTSSAYSRHRNSTGGEGYDDMRQVIMSVNPDD